MTNGTVKEHDSSWSPLKRGYKALHPLLNGLLNKSSFCFLPVALLSDLALSAERNTDRVSPMSVIFRLKKGIQAEHPMSPSPRSRTPP